MKGGKGKKEREELEGAYGRVEIESPRTTRRDAAMAKWGGGGGIAKAR